MNRNIKVLRFYPLIRKSALVITTAAMALTLSGASAQAKVKVKFPDKDFWGRPDSDTRPCDPPAAPEVATWYIGAGVLGMLAIEAMRRKAAGKKLDGTV